MPPKKEPAEQLYTATSKIQHRFQNRAGGSGTDAGILWITWVLANRKRRASQTCSLREVGYFCPRAAPRAQCPKVFGGSSAGACGSLLTVYPLFLRPELGLSVFLLSIQRTRTKTSDLRISEVQVLWSSITPQCLSYLLITFIALEENDSIKPDGDKSRLV